MTHIAIHGSLASSKAGLVLPVVFLALLASSLPCGKAAELIPAERLTNWTPGVTVGVPGGIPTNRTHLIDVTKAPYNADKTGKTDAQPAIVKAINDAKDNDVVFLPAGTYLANHGITVYGGKSRITIRGEGPDKTLIKPSGPQSAGVSVTPADGGDWWYGNRLKLNIEGSYKRGATELTVGDTNVMKDYPKGGVGEIVQIAIKGDKKLPVLSSGGAPGYDRKYITRIVAKTATTVTISPPLLFDVPAELAPIMRPVGRYAESVGLEDLTVDGTDCPSGGCLVGIGQSYGCWVKNVTVRKAQNRLIGLDGSLQCEIRHCNIYGRKTAAGPNGGGLFLGMASHCLIEDNIISPDTEVDGGSAGNVFAYNFCDDDWIQGGLLGMSIDANHAPHNSFNLYEGNYMPRFQADGYWGSCSHDTAFRNWFHASSDKTTQWWVAVNLNRFTRCYNIVGNILGKKGYTWLYEVEMTGFGYGKHYIYSLGFPNMGNGWCNGKTAQPSKGKYWADWDPVVGTTIKGVLTERGSNSVGKITLSSGSVAVEQAPMMKAGELSTFVIVQKVDGKVVTVSTGPWQTKLPALNTEVLLFPGSGGFQELDLDVKDTAILKGNFNYKDNAVPAAESLGGAKLPDSL
ncbi:MAG: glycosyl hydrolase family 28-related protein [Thermoguttaceae bacterium]